MYSVSIATMGKYAPPPLPQVGGGGVPPVQEVVKPKITVKQVSCPIDIEKYFEDKKGKIVVREIFTKNGNGDN